MFHRPLMLTLVVAAVSQLACSTFRGPGPLTGQDGDSLIGADRRPQSVVSRGDHPGAADFPTGLLFDWPVNEARLTQRFLPHKRRRPHWGIDLAAGRGSEILASHHGTVVYTGSNFRGYGRLVIIESGPKWATFYSHLDNILVKEGQAVRPGDIIATMGKTGRATGVHLHFEVRNNRLPVDPLQFLPGGGQI